MLFDLDETILDRSSSLQNFVSWQAHGMLQSEITNKNLFTEKFIELDAYGTVWKDEVYKTLVDEFSITGWSINELVTSYELCFSGFCQPKQGVIEAIKILKNMGKRLALVSNGKSPFQERNFRSLGVSHLFDTVIISEAVGLRKPEKAIFELVCSRLEVKPKESIFIGDNPLADIRGAKEVGMYSVYIPSHYGNSCHDANIVCTNFKDLPDIVESVNVS